MQVLLDSHIIPALVEERQHELPPRLRELVIETRVPAWVSVTSLWELSIKARIGKLALKTPLVLRPEAFFLLGVQLLDIELRHVLAEIGPEPATKDPFDRLLLGVCAAENLKLVTLDRALADHPLAWRLFL
jgi:PIN domain nuclease of toxin-antitoxin system